MFLQGFRVRWDFTGMTTSNNKLKISERGNGQRVAKRRGECVPDSGIIDTRAVDGKQHRDRKRMRMNMSINTHLRE